VRKFNFHVSIFFTQLPSFKDYLKKFFCRNKQRIPIETTFQFTPINNLRFSYKRQQPFDYCSTRPKKTPNQGSHHTRRWRPIDYYSTRQRGFIRPRDDQKPRLPRYSNNHDTWKSTTIVLEKTNQDSQWQRQPADRPSTQKKVLYIRMLKVLQWTPVYTKTKRILQQTV